MTGATLLCSAMPLSALLCLGFLYPSCLVPSSAYLISTIMSANIPRSLESSFLRSGFSMVNTHDRPLTLRLFAMECTNFRTLGTPSYTSRVESESNKTASALQSPSPLLMAMLSSVSACGEEMNMAFLSGSTEPILLLTASTKYKLSAGTPAFSRPACMLLQGLLRET